MEFPSALDPLRSLKAVWRAVRASPGAIAGWWAIGLGGGMLIYGAFYVGVFVLLASGQEVGQDLAWLAGGAALALALGFGLLMFVVQAWWRIGLENVLADTLRTGRSELADAWKPRGRVWALIATQLLVGLAMFATYLPLLVVSVLAAALLRDERSGLVILPAVFLWLPFLAYVGLGFLLAPSAAALDGLGPIGALRRSWQLAKGRRIALLVFWIGVILAALAGLLLLCVGYLATTALTILMPAEAYLALAHPEERRGWWIATDAAGEPPGS